MTIKQEGGRCKCSVFAMAKDAKSLLYVDEYWCVNKDQAWKFQEYLDFRTHLIDKLMKGVDFFQEFLITNQ